MNEQGPPQKGPGTKPAQKRYVAGLTLIGLGILLFMLQVFDGPSESVVLLTIGGVFLAWYLYRRIYGLLIPGCILIGLGLGMLGDRYLPFYYESYEAVGLGVGFILIFGIDWVVQQRSHWWPLIPGVVLIASGVGVRSRGVEWFFSKGWPLILVVIGLFILAGFGRARR